MATSSRAPWRRDLEALRGAAVLLVVAYHAGVGVLAGGFVGVDVLFVLSGYFTAQLLMREYAATGSVDIGAYYGRRALRLLPALLLVVAATLAAVWALYAPIDRADVAATARDVALGVSNLAFARESVDYFGRADSPFLHTWSLAVELQVSLFAPLAFAALAAVGAWTVRARGRSDAVLASRRRLAGLLRGVGLGTTAIAVASLLVGLRWTGTEPAWAFFGTAARVWEFAVGWLLALALPTEGGGEPARGHGTGWWLQVGGIVAILFAATAYDRATPYPGSAAILPVLGAAAVIAGGARRIGPLAHDGWGGRALRWFGGVSYSWYLWHWPVIVVAATVAPTIGVTARLLLSFAALVPAWLTLRWIERPARAAAGDARPAQVRWLAVALGAGVLIALSADLLRRAATGRALEPDQRAFTLAREDRIPHDCWGTLPTRGPSATRCVFGDPNARTTVALFGDSHAEHWLAALDRLGRERGWRIVLLVKGGCPVADAPELVTARFTRSGRECARYRDEAVRALIALQPAVAVLSSWSEYVQRDPTERERRGHDLVTVAAWERGLQRTYARLAGAGVPVVALAGTPSLDFDVPRCLSGASAGVPGAGQCTYRRDAGLHRPVRAAQASVIADLSRRGLPIALVDMSDGVCSTPRCTVVRGGLVVFSDDNHLTARFTRAAAPLLGARMDAALARIGARPPRDR